MLRSASLRHLNGNFDTDNDAVITPVPSCVSADNPARYPPLRYEDHRRMLNLRNFAHRQPNQPAEA